MKKVIPALALIFSAAASAQPKAHNWVMSEGGRYGYEAALSVDDKRAGVQAKPLMMVQYEGKDAAGTHRVMWTDGTDEAHASCAAPCEFVTMYVLGPKARPGETRVRATKGSLIWAVFQDAMAGQLKTP